MWFSSDCNCCVMTNECLYNHVLLFHDQTLYDRLIEHDMYVCTYIRTCVCMYAHTYICMYISTHMCVCVCMYIRAYVCIYMYIHMCVYVCPNIHIHTGDTFY